MERIFEYEINIQDEHTESVGSTQFRFRVSFYGDYTNVLPVTKVMSISQDLITFGRNSKFEKENVQYNKFFF